MIVIDSKDQNDIEKLLKDNNIKYRAFDNVYEATCYEEIHITLENGGYPEVSIERLNPRLSKALYESKYSERAFDRLSDAAYRIIEEDIIKTSEE